MEGSSAKDGRRMTKTTRLAAVCAASVFVAAAIIFIVGMNLPFVIPRYVLEAGKPMPPASGFLLNRNFSAEYAEGSENIDTRVPGIYNITLTAGNSRHATVLEIRDTVAPSARSMDVVVWTGAKVEARDFVRDISDATDVSCSFESAPDTSTAGISEVVIRMTDLSGNSALITSQLRVYALLDKLEVPTKSGSASVKAADFVENVQNRDRMLFVFQTPVTGLDFNATGTHDVAVDLHGDTQSSVLELIDVTPPAARSCPVVAWLGDVLEPEMFIENIDDESVVTASFLTQPDNTFEGVQDVTVILTDSFGNSSEIVSRLALRPDTEPPVITGLLNKRAFVGDTISYRNGVTVTDNRDRNVTLKVDASAVNTRLEGEYPVYYSATDENGNTGEAAGTITIQSTTRKEVEEMADKVLSTILKDGMSRLEKARAVYDWVVSHVGYVNSAPKESIEAAAYRALKYGSGDCYNFYAVSEILLTQAGVDNTPIVRIPGTRTSHYWNLVNTGNGWYHFDTTPHARGGTCFMLTDSQVQELGLSRGRNYYKYDAALYPEIVQ